MNDKAPNSSGATIVPLSSQSDNQPMRRVFIRDLTLDAEIGVWSYEKGKTQKVRFNVDLYVIEDHQHHSDELDHVVCYNQVVEKIQAIAAEGHLALVESMAEKVADRCLDDSRVRRVRVMVEKLEAITAASSVGVEITRENR